MLHSRILFLALITLIGFTMFSCDKDDDMKPEPEMMALLTVSDQVVS